MKIDVTKKPLKEVHKLLTRLRAAGRKAFIKTRKRKHWVVFD